MTCWLTVPGGSSPADHAQRPSNILKHSGHLTQRLQEIWWDCLKMFENGATPKFHGESMFITWIFCMNFPFNGILRVYHYGTPPFQTQSDHMTSTIASSTSGAGRVVSADHRQRQGSGGHCRVLDATCCFSQHTQIYIYIYAYINICVCLVIKI